MILLFFVIRIRNTFWSLIFQWNKINVMPHWIHLNKHSNFLLLPLNFCNQLHYCFFTIFTLQKLQKYIDWKWLENCIWNDWELSNSSIIVMYHQTTFLQVVNRSHEQGHFKQSYINILNQEYIPGNVWCYCGKSMLIGALLSSSAF